MTLDVKLADWNIAKRPKVWKAKNNPTTDARYKKLLSGPLTSVIVRAIPGTNPNRLIPQYLLNRLDTTGRANNDPSDRPAMPQERYRSGNLSDQAKIMAITMRPICKNRSFLKYNLPISNADPIKTISPRGINRSYATALGWATKISWTLGVFGNRTGNSLNANQRRTTRILAAKKSPTSLIPRITNL